MRHVWPFFFCGEPQKELGAYLAQGLVLVIVLVVVLVLDWLGVFITSVFSISAGAILVGNSTLKVIGEQLEWPDSRTRTTTRTRTITKSGTLF
jgi:hypothetical protein